MKTLVLPIFALTIGASFADPIKLELFDLNKNGTFEPDERKAAARHSASALYRDGDTNYDGVLSQSEKDDYIKAELKRAENVVASTEPQISSNPPMSQPDFAKSGMIEISQSGEYWPFYGIQLRRTLADIDRNRDKTRNNPDAYAAKLEAAKPAEFGFTHTLSRVMIVGSREVSSRSHLSFRSRTEKADSFCLAFSLIA